MAAAMAQQQRANAVGQMPPGGRGAGGRGGGRGGGKGGSGPQAPPGFGQVPPGYGYAMPPGYPAYPIQ